MRLLLIFVLLLTNIGCATSAKRLFGISNPNVEVHHSWLFGTYVEVGTDFTGTAKGSYNPETKQVEFDVTVKSAPQEVIAAEAARIDHMEKIREMEFAMITQQTQMMTNMVAQVASAAIGALGNNNMGGIDINAILPQIIDFIKSNPAILMQSIPTPPVP